MYSKCGELDLAISLVLNIDPAKRGIEMWNAIIAAYINHGEDKKAIEVFDQLMANVITPNNSTFTCILAACARSQDVQRGTQVHELIQKSSTAPTLPVYNALLNMYMKCGEPDAASVLFNELPFKDATTINIMLGGYYQAGKHSEVLRLSDQMKSTGIHPTELTYMTVLNACGELKLLARGQQLHSEIVEQRLPITEQLARSICGMYGKCGDLAAAKAVFNQLRKDLSPGMLTWSTIIAACEKNGEPNTALNLFTEMKKGGCIPNEITYISVLRSCAQLKVLDSVLNIHEHLKSDKVPQIAVLQHSLINAYAKCGSFSHAYSVFVDCTEKNAYAWACIINACKNAHSLEDGKRIHAGMVYTGFVITTTVYNALIDMYSDCNSLRDACAVFESMYNTNKQMMDVITWSTMISAYGIFKE